MFNLYALPAFKQYKQNSIFKRHYCKQQHGKGGLGGQGLPFVPEGQRNNSS